MPIYAVSQIATYLKKSLSSDALLQDLWVQGEVSNASHSAAGHWYFTLKDAKAQLRCVMFRPTKGSSGGQHITSGVAVTAHGRVGFYEVRGDLQLYVDLVRPEGVGELALKLDLLKQKLEREGLFEPSRKRPLPPFPKRIGVVTSPASAVWQDIQNVVRRRFPLVELVLAPCQVQGQGAADSIVEAFGALEGEPGVDVVIVARGGGSLEELWPFNEESVARAIFACPVPVVSGVGHETDVTVADMVADVRAPTPSAAAELAVPDARQLISQVADDARRLGDAAHGLLASLANGLETAAARLLRHVPEIATRRQRIDDLLQSVHRHVQASLALHRERTSGLTLRLGALDPSAVLKRGYAVVQRADTGAVVTNPAQVAANERLAVSVADGKFGARVE
ncbi:MAG: exodeoxyribonuclease VII large subunit [Dehalococcoidia bacterium]|nr:exodeoxyribonuclease VII large subunit [Dehalococcoidia bacterium]